MGTRGAFGVIIGEVEKVGYNQFDSYPSGKGIDNLRWLREADLDEVRHLASNVVVVSNDKRPTPEEQERLKQYANTGVSEGSLNDWYCLLRETHGDIGAMLECGYIEDHSTFLLDSLFCEWAYLLDLDKNVFEVYQGFQQSLPTAGRVAGRPTKEENEKNYAEHVEWCKTEGRDPWLDKEPKYKAVQLVASYPLDALPSDEDFLAIEAIEVEVELA